MSMLTITNNAGENIPIQQYAQNIYNDGELGGDAEISMLPLIYNTIRVATYRMILDKGNNAILGYEYINSYGDLNDPNTSILILININNNHWVTGYFNPENGAPINEFNIPTISMYNNKSNLENKIESKLDKENIYIKDILNKYNTFKDLLNNMQNKDIEKIYEFYNSGKNIIDFSQFIII